MFLHANITHLTLNALAFLLLNRTLKHRFPVWAITLGPYLAAAAASFIITYPRPTVGASGMTYTLTGMYLWNIIRSSLPPLFRRRRAGCETSKRVGGKKSGYWGIITTAVALTTSAFRQNSATALHISCLLFGIAIAAGLTYKQNKK
jgi:membrane associated rhomboid family serine protease